MKKFFGFFLVVFCLSSLGEAQRRRYVEEQPQWTWDLGFAFGQYANYSYSEIDLGLNDHFTDIFNWRNMVFDRFGSSSVTSTVGVDSSLRYEYVNRGGDGPGFKIYVGPGVRLASNNYTGDFVEGGVIFRFGGLSLGGGVKALNYFSPGTDPSTGLKLPGSDLMYFILIGGGGAL